MDTYIPNMVKEEEKLGPSNPFLEETVCKDPLVDVIMQTVQGKITHVIKLNLNILIEETYIVKVMNHIVII